LVFTGFANGTVVALRSATGSVAWMTSLKGDAEQFVDVDSLPQVLGETVYVSSSSGGVYARHPTTGLVRWRLPIDGAGSVEVEDGRVYVAAANTGVFAVDAEGNVVWRQGLRGGGEPADPIVTGEYLIYTLSKAGLFVADKRSGQVYQ